MNPGAPAVGPAFSGQSRSTSGSQLSTLHAQPPSIPDHELLKKIGDGSYGEVWLARTILGELRAVKIVHRSSFDDDRPFQREFEGIQKFEPISRSHPSQLAILHVGRNEADGYFYYVMELADPVTPDAGCSIPDTGPADCGRSIHLPASSIQNPESYIPRTLRSELKARGRLPPSECIGIALALAEALAHLHKHGLVHRDIKPSNIIFVGGVPKLADIGLVTDVDASRSFVGTEGYLPPEGPGTPEADIYSLGKVLYELCTGKDRKDYPALPPDLRERPASEQHELMELNAVLVKACASEPHQRYQTADELHADLVVLQLGQSLKRRRRMERRWLISKKAALASVVLAVLIAGGWFVSTNVNWRKPGTTERKVTPSQQQEAQRLYREGYSYAAKQTKDGCAEAVRLFNRAIALDPQYVQAHLGLADTYCIMSGWYLPPKQVMPEAMRNTLKALELNNTSAEAHARLAFIKWIYEWDWLGAEREYKRAIELDRTSNHGYGGYAILLRALGRVPEARAAQRRALELNPTSLRCATDMGWQLVAERQYGQAIEHCLKLVAKDTNYVRPRLVLAQAYEFTGRYSEALEQIRTVQSIDASPNEVALAGRVYARMGQRQDALKVLEGLKGGYSYVSPRFPAQVYAALGEKERAMDYLENAGEEKELGLIDLKWDPALDGLRDHPRFIALLRKMGLEK